MTTQSSVTKHATFAKGSTQKKFEGTEFYKSGSRNRLRNPRIGFKWRGNIDPPQSIMIMEPSIEELNNDFLATTNRGTSRAKYWVFTMNNYTNEDVARLRDITTTHNEVVAFISWGFEIAPTTGTPHLQGQLELRAQLRWNQVRSLLGPQAWLAVRRGTFEQAEEYVEKGGEHEQYGERVSSERRGQRQDLVHLREDLNSGSTLRYIAQNHFSAFIRYQRGILAYRLLHATPRTWRTEVIVYWGRTGTGKTEAVYENLQSLDDLWTQAVNGKWFDGYDDHPYALIDEFKPAQFDITFLLRLLDRYPMRVEVKGGFTNWAPREIYLTSNMDPSTWYLNALPEHRAALKRRIGHVVQF